MRAEEKKVMDHPRGTTPLFGGDRGAALGGVPVLTAALVAFALFLTAGPEAAVAEPAGGESAERYADDARADGEEKSDEKSEESAESAEAEAEDAENLEPLPLELPNPVFAGTPQEVPDNVRVDRRRLGKRRPQFMAPKGVENVAEGKDVTSSDDFPIIGTLELVTDGDKQALDGRFVELAPGKQQVTIDLEDTYEIYAVVFWHNHMDPRVYRDVVVQVSDDEDFVDATTIYNNDNDNSLGMGVGEDYEYFESDEGELVDAEGIEARYVRLWSNGSTADDQNHYTEVEVWALPADEE